MCRLGHTCTSQRNIFPEDCSWSLISICTSADKSHGLIFRSAQTYHWSNHGRVATETLGPLTAQGSFYALLPDTRFCRFVPLRVWLTRTLESRPLHGCYGYKGRSEIRILKQEFSSSSCIKREASSTNIAHCFISISCSPYNAQKPSRLSPSVWFLLSSFGESSPKKPLWRFKVIHTLQMCRVELSCGTGPLWCEKCTLQQRKSFFPPRLCSFLSLVITCSS